MPVILGRVDILDQVKTMLESTRGVKFVEIGLPVGPIPFTSCPFIYLTTSDAGGTDITFGGSARNQDLEWDVNINMVFGPADYPLANVVADAQPYPSRVRAVLSPDYKLGGLVGDSDLLEAIDNFETYREAGVVPMMRWKLHIHQYRTADASPE